MSEAMASRVLFVLCLCTCFSTVTYTAAPPVNVALNKPFDSMVNVNTLTLNNVTLPTNGITFKVPGTQISLVLSKFAQLISQAELDLCVIEAIASIFTTTLAKGKDGPLPLNSVDYKYGNVVINVHDFSAPAFSMTYASVVATLRGIALFSSLHGYRGMVFDVYDGKIGHVGTGDWGPIIPR